MRKDGGVSVMVAQQHQGMERRRHLHQQHPIACQSLHTLQQVAEVLLTEAVQANLRQCLAGTHL